MKVELLRHTGDDTYRLKVLSGAFFLLASDALWIGVVARKMKLYDTVLPEDVDSQRVISSMILYSVIAGMVSSVFYTNEPKKSIALGAMLGFLVFSTYNLTTWATLPHDKSWLVPGLVDTMYGTIVWAVLFYVEFVVVKKKQERTTGGSGGVVSGGL
jgi:uncharacterized membrane protein